MPPNDDSQTTDSKKVPHKMDLVELQIHLSNLGSDHYDLILPETKAILDIIMVDETILGVIFGKYKMTSNNSTGRGALVATSHRVILVDKKPLYGKFQEITYDVVSGVTYNTSGFGSKLILHTRLGDIDFQTLNKKAITHFVNGIESKIYNNENK